MSLLFSKEHEWIKIEGNIGTVGITDHAMEQLGDITYVELPEIGLEVPQDDILCSIESVKAASDIYNPMSGKVSKVNESLEDAPEVINESPQDKGWIVQIELSNMSEKDSLLSETEYLDYVKGLED